MVYLKLYDTRKNKLILIELKGKLDNKLVPNKSSYNRLKAYTSTEFKQRRQLKIKLRKHRHFV